MTDFSPPRRPFRLKPSPGLLLLLCALAAGLHTLWLALRGRALGGSWASAQAAGWFDHLLSLPPPALAALLAWRVAARHRGAERRAWLWLAAGLLAFALGSAVWGWRVLVTGQDPFPSVADLCFLAWPLAFGLALHAFPRAPLSPRERLRLGLDSAVLIGAGGLWLYQGLLAPNLAALVARPAAELWPLVYPLLDLGLLVALVPLALRLSAPLPTLLSALGLGLFAAADLGFAYLEAVRGYARGQALDGLWSWGAAAFALAAWVSLRSGSREAAPRLRSLPPLALYGALLATVGFALWADRAGAPGLTNVLRVLHLLVVLVAVRQTLAWRDKERLERQLFDLTQTLEARVLERGAQVQRTFEGGLLALGVALEVRDLETSGHTERVVRLAQALGRAVGIGESDFGALTQGASLHDLGKLAIPDAILHKPGKLTPQEFELMKTHARSGHEIAARLPHLAPGALDVVLHHHEKWDGSGYPFGLAGTDIPLLARIFAVCDVYDALISERPYKRAWTPQAALEEIAASAGRHFDPRVAQAFGKLDLAAVLGPVEYPGAAQAAPRLTDPARALQQALDYAGAVTEVSRLTTSELDAHRLGREVLRVVAGPCALDWGGLVVIEGDVGRVRPLWSRSVRAAEQPEYVVPRDQGVMWNHLQHDEVLFVDDYAAHPGAMPLFVRRGAGAVAWLPLSVEASRTVILSVMRRVPAPPWSPQDRRLLEAAARSARAALERQAHVQRLEKAAFRDPLTGLGNRRALEEHLERILARRGAVGVMLLDVDCFRAVNDRFGPARGDELLQALALALRWNVRAEDVVYRLGGDRFMVVFQEPGGPAPALTTAAALTPDPSPGPDPTPEPELGAASVPASVQARVMAAARGMARASFPGVGVSLGVARSPQDGTSVKALLRVAEERLDRTKSARGGTGAASAGSPGG